MLLACTVSVELHLLQVSPLGSAAGMNIGAAARSEKRLEADLETILQLLELCLKFSLAPLDVCPIQTCKMLATPPASSRLSSVSRAH